MESTKLATFLRLLTEKEFIEFCLYVENPMFNVKNDVIHLTRAINNFYPEFSDDTISEDKLCLQLFSDKKNPKNQLRQTMTFLIKQVEKYLALTSFLKDDIAEQKYLIRAYSERNLYEQFQKTSNQLIGKLEETPFAAEHMKTLIEVNEQIFFHPNTDKFSTQVTSLEKVIYYTESFYLLSMCRRLVEVLNRRRIYNEKSRINVTPEFLQMLGQSSIPSATVYYSLLKLLSSENIEDIYFEQTLEKLRLSIQSIEKEDAQIIAHHLTLYANYASEQGKSEYLHKLQELNTFIDKANCFIYNKTISFGVYLNVIILGSYIKKYDWTEKFIKKYYPYLKKSIRKEAKIIAQCYLSLFQQMENPQQQLEAYEALLQKCDKINYTHSVLKIHTEILILRIYYELFILEQRHPDLFEQKQGEEEDDYFDKLTKKADSFRKYFSDSHALSLYKRKAIINFLYFIQKLCKKVSDPNRTKEDKEILLTEISEKDFLFSRTWLKDKVNELKW